MQKRTLDSEVIDFFRALNVKLMFFYSSRANPFVEDYCSCLNIIIVNIGTYYYIASV